MLSHLSRCVCVCVCPRQNVRCCCLPLSPCAFSILLLLLLLSPFWTTKRRRANSLFEEGGGFEIAQASGCNFGEFCERGGDRVRERGIYIYFAKGKRALWREYSLSRYLRKMTRRRLSLPPTFGGAFAGCSATMRTRLLYHHHYTTLASAVANLHTYECIFCFLIQFLFKLFFFWCV